MNVNQDYETQKNIAYRDPEPGTAEKIIFSLVGGISLALALMLATVILWQLVFIGRIYPGVSVNGISLGFMRKADAEALLSEKITYPNSGVVYLRDGEHSWLYTPADLGFKLDAGASVKQAYRIGRQGFPWDWVAVQLEIMRKGRDIAPVFVFNTSLAQAQLSLLALEINQPTIEAELWVEGMEVYTSPGQVGRELNSWFSAGMIGQFLQTMQAGEVTLAVESYPPQVLDASPQAEIARSILNQPLKVSIPGAKEKDPGPWLIEPESLSGMLHIQRSADENGVVQYTVGLSPEKLRPFLESIGPGVAVDIPRNARFMFNDETGELELLEEAVIGRELLVEDSINSINQQIAQGSHVVELAFDYSLPEVTSDVTGKELGIIELVSEQTTYFYGSSTSRLNNIEVASSQFHGLLVPPNSTFSMVEYLGDVSLDSGYAEALIIYGDRTVKGVGGGVCQVSTTLFRTVFFGGFPIVERYSHSYRVKYYEQNYLGQVDNTLAGLDATVYAPLVDFKFNNDTPYWLLMETYMVGNSLTWKFYSTSDGREVQWDSGGLTDIVEPPDPVYEVVDDLPNGTIEQVDWEAEGANVEVYRWVYRDGSLYFEDTIKTHYNAWADVYQCGPNTEDCPPKEIKEVPKSNGE